MRADRPREGKGSFFGRKTLKGQNPQTLGSEIMIQRFWEEQAVKRVIKPCKRNVPGEANLGDVRRLLRPASVIGNKA